MDESLTIIRADHPFNPASRHTYPVAFRPGMTVADLPIFKHAACIIHNGQVVEDLNVCLQPGDVVHVYPHIEDDPLKAVGLIALSVLAFAVVGPAATGFLTAGGMGASAAGVWGTLAAVGTVTAGGLMLTGLIPDSADHSHRASDGRDSPTYGWQPGKNQTTEGAAIPVIYGNTISYPHIINFYKEIDANGDEWMHTLLCVGEGETNNVVTADNIYIDSEPLAVFDSDNYDVFATDGSSSPDTDELVKFEKIHQMRFFDKLLKYKDNDVAVLLHFNGDDGSTVIDDDGFDDNDWTCQATSSLTTTDKFLGTACLNLETDGDYISCDNLLAHNIWNYSEWDLEVRFRQNTLTDSAICGSKSTSGSTVFYWGLFYISGNLVYQQYKLVSGTPTIYWNMSRSVSLTAGTWHHIRVARGGTSPNYVFIYVDGVLQGTGSTATTATEWPIGGSTYEQWVGGGYYWDGSTTTVKYGNCKLDEYRLVQQANSYGLPSYTPPTKEFSNDNAVQYYRTKCEVDEFSIIISAKYGLYTGNASGGLDARTVNFKVRYRKVGNSTWTDSNQSIQGESRYPVREQFDFDVSSNPGRYDVKVIRTSVESTDDKDQDRISWISIDEILDEFLHYPYLQCVSVSLRAQDEISGTVPTFRIESNVSLITVPNFDGVGTQSVNPSNNSWAAYDMLTNNIYGPGVDPTRFIEADFSAWETWCDTTVNGNKRAQLNMIFDGNYDLDRAIQHIEQCGRAKIINRGTSIGVVVERPGSPADLYADGANIIKGTGKLTFLPQSERSDAVEIKFYDKDNDWQDATARAKSTDFETLSRPPRITRLTIPGINNSDQATREAIFRQQISENLKRSIDFQSGIESVRCTVGDLINIRHGGNNLTYGGRIGPHPTDGDSYSGGTIYLDQQINLASATYSGNCTFTFRENDDTLTTATVTGPFDTDTFFINVNSLLSVNRFDPFMITRTTGEITQYKIFSVQRSGNIELSIKGLQYVDSSYYNSSYDSGNTPI